MKEKYPKEHSNFFSFQTTTPALLEKMNLQFIFKKKKTQVFFFLRALEDWQVLWLKNKQTNPKNLLSHLLISWLCLN